VNDCIKAEVRDALPDFINHRLSELDAATMREHIESCADCKAELEIIRQACAAALLAPKMNVDRIVAALPSYSSAGSPYSVRSGSRKVWALAAAATIVAIAGWGISTRSVTSDAPAVAAVASAPATPVETASPAIAPNTVAAAPSQNVDESTDEVEVASLSLLGSTQDLTDEDLETLVAALDGIDGVPSAEPNSVTTIVEGMGGNDDQ